MWGANFKRQSSDSERQRSLGRPGARGKDAGRSSCSGSSIGKNLMPLACGDMSSCICNVPLIQRVENPESMAKDGKKLVCADNEEFWVVELDNGKKALCCVNIDTGAMRCAECDKKDGNRCDSNDFDAVCVERLSALVCIEDKNVNKDDDASSDDDTGSDSDDDDDCNCSGKRRKNNKNKNSDGCSLPPGVNSTCEQRKCGVRVPLCDAVQECISRARQAERMKQGGGVSAEEEPPVNCETITGFLINQLTSCAPCEPGETRLLEKRDFNLCIEDIVCDVPEVERLLPDCFDCQSVESFLVCQKVVPDSQFKERDNVELRRITREQFEKCIEEIVCRAPPTTSIIDCDTVVSFPVCVEAERSDLCSAGDSVLATMPKLAWDACVRNVVCETARKDEPGFSIDCEEDSLTVCLKETIFGVNMISRSVKDVLCDALPCTGPQIPDNVQFYFDPETQVSGRPYRDGDAVPQIQCPCCDEPVNATIVATNGGRSQNPNTTQALADIPRVTVDTSDSENPVFRFSGLLTPNEQPIGCARTVKFELLAVCPCTCQACAFEICAREDRCVWYVRHDPFEPLQEDGLTWLTAFTDIKMVFNELAQPGDQIWVEKGTFDLVPTSFAPTLQALLLLKPGVEVYGGFEAGQTSIAKRGNDYTFITMTGIVAQPAPGTFLCGILAQVTAGQVSDQPSLLDQFSIVDLNGTNNESLQGYALVAGACVSDTRSNVVFQNVALYNNDVAGIVVCGGLTMRDSFVEFSKRSGILVQLTEPLSEIVCTESFPTCFERVLFQNNATPVSTTDDENVEASALIVRGVGMKAKVDKCRFIGNCTTLDGAAISITRGANVCVSGSLFKGNCASGFGGAIYVEGKQDEQASFVNIVQSVATRNVAGEAGGVLAIKCLGKATIEQSTFSLNAAGSLGGGAVFTECAGDLQVRNTIMWNDVSEREGKGFKMLAGVTDNDASDDAVKDGTIIFVNPQTGAQTGVFYAPDADESLITGLATTTTSDAVWAVNANNCLLQFDANGNKMSERVMTGLGEGETWSDLSMQPFDDVLYGSTVRNVEEASDVVFYTIDMTTAAAKQVSTFPAPGSQIFETANISFDWCSSKLILETTETFGLVTTNNLRRFDVNPTTKALSPAEVADLVLFPTYTYSSGGTSRISQPTTLYYPAEADNVVDIYSLPKGSVFSPAPISPSTDWVVTFPYSGITNAPVVDEIYGTVANPIEFDSNIIQGNPSQKGDSDPLFVDPVKCNFQLLGQSPAIDCGNDVVAEDLGLVSDYNGNARKIKVCDVSLVESPDVRGFRSFGTTTNDVDIGAYEFVPSACADFIGIQAQQSLQPSCQDIAYNSYLICVTLTNFVGGKNNVALLNAFLNDEDLLVENERIYAGENCFQVIVPSDLTTFDVTLTIRPQQRPDCISKSITLQFGPAAGGGAGGGGGGDGGDGGIIIEQEVA